MLTQGVLSAMLLARGVTMPSQETPAAGASDEFGGPDPGPEDELGATDVGSQDELGGPDRGPEDELGATDVGSEDELGGPDAGTEDEFGGPDPGR
jgi:hypothetical protein